MQPITAVIIGAGGRGFTFADYARRHPFELKIVGVADPNDERRSRLANQHRIPDDRQYLSWESLLSEPRMAEAAIITTMDPLHFHAARKAIEADYHILLEKPMSPVPYQCLELADRAEQKERILTVCHSLRYTPFFQEIKGLLTDAIIGRLINIQLTENVGYWHQAHSFVRGNWRNVAESSPMLLSKSCHDIDILHWLVGTDCARVSSFGSLSFFREENAPPGAPARCTDGCPVEDTCAYSALKIYLKAGGAFAAERHGGDGAAAYQALQKSPYSRCVFRCDNDVVDHQVVNLEFVDGATASFTMCAFSYDVTRTIKLFGTDGEIRGHMEKGEVEITLFRTGERQTRHVLAQGGHDGGDEALAHRFVQQVRSEQMDGLTSGRASAASHLITFAAENSRLSGQVVDIETFKAEVEQQQKSVLNPNGF